MKQAEEKGAEQRLLDASLVLLVAYNALFLWDVIFSDHAVGQAAATFMAFIDSRRGWVTLFEAIAALSLFADLVVRFDYYPYRNRQFRIVGIAIAMTGFVFKAFAFYLDSAYLE